MESLKEQKKKAEKIYKAFLITAKYWISELDFYGPNQFKEKVTDTSWTMGQVYDHLINGTYQFHLQQIEHCLLNVHGNATGKKTFKGKLLYFFGSYPRKRYLKPENRSYFPIQPEGPMKVKDELFKFMKHMQKTGKQLETATLNYKTLHPLFGMLNAIEWYKLAEMHFRHHLRQKRRLDKTLRSNYKAIPGEEVYYEV